MRRYLLLLLGVFLVACANPSAEYTDTKFAYDGGQIAAIDHNGNCYIYISGAITPGLVPPFNRAMNNITHRECDQRVVMVNSHGGDIEVAMHMGREIRELELNTDMHGFCESACVFIYIGGVKRMVHLNHHTNVDSKFGVHQPASELLFHQCVSDSHKFPQITQLISQYLARMLPPLAARTLKQDIFETSCNQIRYVEPQDMLSSGIATDNLDSH